MYMFPELQKLTTALEDVNIHITGENHAGYTFDFDGNEDEFVNALELMMATTDYSKQDPDWFPGDPGDVGENEYYLTDNDTEFCISFKHKIMSHLV